MKTKLIVFIAFVSMCVMLGSCGNSKKQNQSKGNAETALSIDAVLEQAESLVDANVVIEGVCTHTCSHGAKKMFLVGSDNTKTLRIEAGELGAFDAGVVNCIVTVNGTLKEERIDEAYLLDWEAKLKNQEDEKHGDGDGGCQTEKDARGETANTPESRIADFRAKIAVAKETKGKDYLSFYYVVAESYEINK